MTLSDLLIRHEGLRLKPYKDSVGIITIGVGRNLEDVGISKAEAMFLLTNDIARAEGGLDQYMPNWWRHLSQVRRMALVDMAFNLGIQGLMGFKHFLAALRAGNYGEAKAQMLDSHWAEQVGRRADELAAMVLDETLPT